MKFRYVVLLPILSIIFTGAVGCTLKTQELREQDKQKADADVEMMKSGLDPFAERR
jgi:hypothetical protein